MYNFKQITAEEIAADRDKCQKDYGHLGFTIHANSVYYIAECNHCGDKTFNNPEMWMTYIHTGCRTEKLRKRYALSTPAAEGDTVTQGHRDYCKTNGHMYHKVGGVDTGICPRCGGGY